MQLQSGDAVAVVEAGSCSSYSTPSLNLHMAEPPYVEGVALKSKKKLKKNKTRSIVNQLYFNIVNQL